MPDNDALLYSDDAAAIGFQIVEMVDRLNGVVSIIPNVQAKWSFTVDGVSYDVTVSKSKG